MPFAPRSTLNCAKMQTKMSTWTPLNHQLSNNNVFEERRNLLRKWFDKWTDGQRKAVLQDFFSRCTVVQLRFLRQSLSLQVAEEAVDFTSVLPRVLSLYIFSFLDPRSLCRCTQVSWHWRGIVDLDQLWMPKCLRLGWYISFSPSPYEQGVWKRHYLETVKELHASRPKTHTQQEFVVPEVTAISRVEKEPSDGALRGVYLASSIQRARGSTGRSSGTQPTELPPWRDSDRHPKDTLRFNYLANLDPIEQSHQVRTTSRGVNPPIKAQPDTASQKPLSAANYKLRKAKSLMFLSLDLGSGSRPCPHQKRPPWASHNPDYPDSKDTTKSLSRSAHWNAGIRPGPVRLAVPTLSRDALRVSQRTQRSAPTTPLFESQPWKVPVHNQDSDEE
ncbi:F-box only protein 16 [Osmerus mordax]|uniref:F-box only protein 16 n=1 Tax=Osmerus mordax TaxID=8014 RepID=UPI00350F947D